MTPRERPILFSGAMVRSILAGRKSQTRRLVQSNARFGSAPRRFWQHADLDRAWPDGKGTPEGYLHVPAHDAPGCAECERMGWEGSAHRLWTTVPPGTRLWVREAWAHFGGDEYLYQQDRGSVAYRATFQPTAQQGPDYVPGGRWRPGIHMPRWASRLTLEVVRVRVERLQEITEEDAIAEGVAGLAPEDTYDSARAEFAAGWDTLNGKRAPWDANSWVWVIDFRRVEA